jgi:ABC-type transport system substrate-binding protein
MPSNETPDSRALDIGSLTRRDLVAMGSVAGITGLAGCGGDGQPQPTPHGSGDGPTESTVDGSTMTTRIEWNWSPGDTNFSSFGQASNYPSAEAQVFFEPLIGYSPTKQEFVYELADGPPTMESGCELHVKIKDGYTWWDGTPVTAKERVIQGQLVSWLCCGGPEEVPWAPVLVDDSEFYEVKRGHLNDSFASINMMKTLNTKYDHFEPFLERFQDATTDSERQSVGRELLDHEISLDQVIEEGYGTGLWKPVSYSSSTITFEKYADHPHAGRTDLEEWRWKVVPTDQSFYQALKQDSFDYGTTEYRRNVQNPPSHIEPVIEYPGRFGRKLGMSWRNEHLARRPVRRAIGYLLNLEGLAGIIDQVTPVTQQTVGMPDSLVEKYVGSSFLDEIIDYGTDARPEKAAETLRTAGYERSGGVWRDADGKAIRGLNFIASSNADDALIGNTISAQLSNFGIKNDFSTLEPGSYRSLVDPKSGSGEFDLSIHVAGPLAPHPSRIWSFKWPRTVDNFAGVADIGKPEGCTTEPPAVTWTGSETPTFRIPVDPVPAYPEHIGATEIDGDEQELEPIRSSIRLRYDLPEEELREVSQQWAWWFNFNLFHVNLHSIDRMLWLDSENFTVSDDATITGVNLGQGPMANGYLSSADGV